MTSFRELRPMKRLAQTGRFAVLAVALTALGVVLALTTLVLRGNGSPTTPRFLTKALGAPQARAPLVRKPVGHVTVSIAPRGYQVAKGRAGSVSLTSLGTGTAAWQRFENGVSRPTSFGRETITLTNTRTEELLTVRKRQGLKTWRWRLGSPTLEPSLRADGSIDYLTQAGARAGLRVLPVRILDSAGRDVTPAGLRWSLDRGLLTLRLDDAKLPLPFVIDPAVDYPATQYLSNGASATQTVVPDYALATASGTQCTNCMSLSLTTTAAPYYIQIRPATTAWGTAANPPATPDGRGWIVDTGGSATPNDTVIPSGSWTFQTTTVDSKTRTGGPIYLAVGLYKVTTSGGAITASSVILDPTQAAQHDNVNLVSTTTAQNPSITVAGVPEISLNATEHILVELFVYDPTAALAGAATLSVYANGANQFVTHPAATTRPSVPASPSPAAGTALSTYTPTLQDTFNDPDTGAPGPDTGQINFNLCSDSACSTVVKSYTSATGLSPSGGAGSATVAVGDVTSDAHYWWQAQAQDNHGVKSAWSTPRALDLDKTPPTAPSVALTSPPAWYTAASVGLTPTDGNDPVAGVDTTTRVYQRDETTMTGGVCNAFPGTWGTTVSNPDVTVQNGKCYRYRMQEADKAGNVSAWSAASGTATVDLQGPTAPTLTFGSLTNAYASGSTVYYNPGVAGSFTVTAAGSTDAASGFSSYTFPSFWTTSGTGASRTYTWTAGPAAPGAQAVTPVDVAGNNGTTAPFTPTADSSLPSTSDDSGSIGAGWKTTSQTVTLTPTDTGSGVANTYYTTDGSAPTTGSSSGTSIPLGDGVYTIKYFSLDRVGNQEAVQTAGTQIHVDTTPPSTAILTALPAAIKNGQALSATAADATSGVASVAYYYCAGTSCSPSTLIGSSSAGPGYFVTWSSQPADGSYQVLARVTDNAGLTTDSAKQTVTIDNTAPTMTIDSQPAAQSNVTGPSFTFSSPDGTAAFQCRLDGAAYAACSSPKSYAGLTDGSHSFDVKAVDPAGNESSVHNVTWTVDTVAPPISLDSHPADPSNTAAPTFTFSSTDGTATFECQIDTGLFGACSSPKSYAGLADGSHTFTVHAKDPAGNTSSNAAWTWTVDTTPPTTTVSAQPPALTSSNSASFSFSADETVTGYQCSLDGGAFSACTTGVSYTGLADGAHSFSVKATADTAGNAGNATTPYNWTVDTTPPATTLSAQPSNPTNATSATFSFSANETVTGFQCRLDGGAFSACSSGVSYTGLAEGSHTFDVKATADSAGNAGTTTSYPWTVDTTAPVTTISSAPSDPANSNMPSFSFGANEPVTGFQCQMDGAGWNPCTSPKSYPALADGSHTFQVEAVADTAGNPGGPASHTWTVDTTAPTTTVTSQPSNPTNQTSASFSFSASESVTGYQCSLDGGAYAACSSPASYTGLSEGAHSFQVKAVADTAGNAGTATAPVTWTVDTTPPATTISAQPSNPTNAVSASFSFGASETVTGFQCRIDGGAFSACSSGVSYSGLAEGSHTFDVKAVADSAGNAGTTTSYTWTVDTTAPTTTISGKPSNPSNDTAPAFTFSASESVTGYRCRLDGGAWSACSSGVSFGGLADGSHTFDVEAVADLAGNAGTAASYTWTVDTTAPTTTINGNPANPTNVTSATFSFSANETVSGFQCRLDGGAWSACSSGVSYTGLTEGAHTFDVKATADSAGNPGTTASYPWTVDTTPPSTTLSAQPADPTNATSASFSFVASETVLGYLCRLDGGSFSACSSGVSFTGLAPGAHTFDVKATQDTAGNAGTTTSYGWTVDTTAPTTTLSAQPSDPTNATSASFSFSASETVTGFHCQLDGGGFAPCTSPQAYAGPLGDGSHTFQVKADADSAGNAGTTTSFTWTVDTTAPATTISAQPANPSNDTAPSFSFAAGEPVTGYQCRLDGGAFAACTSPHALSGLAEGSHTFDVKAVADTAGNAGTTTSYTWTVDTTAPTTTINAQPPVATSSTSASFSFAAGETVTGYQCQLDGGGFSACTSPSSYAGLADGSHTFSVKAVADSAGNAGTTTSYTWTVDTTAPDTSITAQPAAQSNDTSPSFSFTSPDAGASFQCRLDLAAWAPCTSPISFASLADGPHTFDVRAVDAVGNVDATPASVTWTVDTVAPTANVTGGPGTPTNATSASFTFSSPDGGTSFQCALDGASYAPCTSPASVTGVAEGAHVFHVKATDAAGNTGGDGTYGWTVDTTAPTTTISASPSNPSNQTTGSVSFSANEPSTFQCRLDGGSWSACTSPASFPGLTDGSHTVDVQSADTAGNAGSVATVSWTVDTVGPTTSITSQPGDPTNQTSAGFAYAPSESGSTFLCSLDGAGYTACGSTTSYTGLADGSHTFRVESTDPAGNTGAPAAFTWTVDTTSPAPSITAQPADPTNQTAATFSFTSTKPGTFTCSLDGAAYASCTSPTTYTGLAAGPHSFDVKTTDTAGNTGGPVTATWTVDTTAPTTTLTSTPAASSNDTAPSFAFSASEPSTFQCKLDGAAWSACTSPVSLSGLAEGSHTFQVQATDAATNTGAAAGWTWTVDTTPPSASVDTHPSDPTNTTSASFGFSSPDGGTSFQCQLDGSGFAPCSSPKAYAGPLGDGSHTFQVKATDAAGNTGTATGYTWTVDTVAPTASVDTHPPAATNSTSASFTFSSTDGGTSFQCALDTGSYASCSGTTSYAGLLDGVHTFHVKATDAAGNTGTDTAYAWTVDTVAPAANVTGGPATPTNATSASFTFSSPDGGTSFQCALDGGAYSACSSPDSLTGIAEGAHTFHVKATDAAGNTGADATYTWTVDLTPPTTTLSNTPPDPTNATAASPQFSASEAVSGFECSLDAGAYAPCTSPAALSGLAEGTHTYRVRATDLAGNTGAAALATWTVDTTPPTATISSAPADPTKQTSATFAFSATETSTYACSLDGAAAAPCTSPVTYSGLGESAHTFSVVATDAAGNASTAATAAWTVDTTPPTASVATHPSDPTNATSASFTFSASEPGSTFECDVDGFGYSSCTSPRTYAGPLAQGTHTFSVRATDPAGNTGAAAASTWTVDTTAPTTTISSSPTDPTSATTAIVAFSASEPATFQCSLDGGAFGTCASPASWAGLGEGLHTVRVEATDAAGNTGAAAGASWTVDTTAPTATIDAKPALASGNASPSFQFSASEPSSFQCKLDAGAWASCSSPDVLAGLADGSHTFSVEATDAAGNTSSAVSYTWTVDTVAPTTTISSSPSSVTSQTTGTVAFSAGETATFECRIDAGAWSACTSPATWTSLLDGSHTVDVRATDAAGNVGPAASATWTVDTQAPSATIGAKPFDPTNALTASFGFSSSETGSTFECSLDGAAYAPCATPQNYAGLTAGAHTFDVRATDAAGNTGSAAAYSWTIDRTAPTASVTSGPADPTNATSATLVFSADEASTFECSLDAGAWAPCSSPASYTGLGETTHTFQVRATDTAGNTGAAVSYGWRVDTTAPTVTVSSQPANPTNATAATFAFSANETSTFQCTLDGGAAAPCTSPDGLTGLGEGIHTFSIVATDQAGNAAAPVTVSWVVDLTAPTVTVSSQPANPTNATTASFGFSSADGGTSFQCALDGGAYSACSSPDTLTGLPDGSHTFHVKATDAAGNTGTDAAYTWTVDTTAPTATVDTHPAALTNSTSASFGFSSPDGGTSFQCALDGGAFSACTSPQAYSSLAEGSHTFHVKATDAAGNTGTDAAYTWTVDTTAPTATVDTHPAAATNSTGATFTFSSADGGTSFQCALDLGGFGPCTSPVSYTSLADGSHTFHVETTDAAGNTSADATYTWTVDTVAPTTTIGTKPAALSNTAAPSFGFTADEPATFQCKLDAGAWSACSSPDGLGGLADGSHTFSVEATDPAGNTGAAASYTWTVDTTAPTASVDTFPNDPTNQTSASFTFSASESATYQCELDGAGFAACTSPTSYSGLASGSHTFSVKATDAAGNTGSAAGYTWTVDTSAPNVTIDSGPANPTNATTASVAFTADPGTTVTCKLDSGSFAPCTSPVSYSGLTEGSHTVQVKATNGAGTPSTASYTWTIDLTAPTAHVDSSPASPTNATSASFGFSSPDGGTSFQCALDGGAYSACSPPDSLTGIAEGAHTFHVRATDAAGNTGTDATATWTVDLTAPSTSIGSGPASPTNATSGMFSFSASELATFECKLDTGAWAACSSPATVAGPLAEGAHSFQVRATDPAGNMGAAATYAWTVDLTAPAATVDAHPAALTNATSASFGFSSADGGTSFQCALDGGAYSACSSPDSLSGITEGSHTFHVKATDAAGNTGTDAAYTWTVDTTAPTASVDTHPADPTNATSASFGFSSPDGGTSFQCALDGGAFSACTSPASYSGLGDGSHTFHVKATDAAGNTSADAAYTWTVDTTGPTTTVTSAPPAQTNVTTATFSFTASESGSSFECSLDGAAFAACGSPVALSSLAEGSHTFKIRATDPIGNTGAEAAATWTVDLTAPSATVDSQPSSPTNATTASFSFSSADGGTSFECSLDGGAFSSCSSPKAYSGLAEGAHTFGVRATDAAGNTGGAVTASWTVDLTGPTVTIASGPADPTNQTSASFTFSAPDAAGYECALDGGAYAACSSPQSLSGIANGAHTFHVRGTDAAGNTGAAADYPWTVDTSAPSLTIDSGPADPTNASTATFGYTADPGTVSCRIDGGAWLACASPVTFTGVGAGPHAFDLEVTNGAGTTSTASRTWTVDTTAPVTSITAQPASVSTSAAASFSFAADEAVTGYECSLDSAAFASCSSPQSYTGLADGAHGFRVRAVADLAGNAGAAASASWTVDTTPPSTTVGTQPASLTNQTGASFSFSASEAVTGFQCRLDSGTWGPCSSPETYTGLADGPHTFDVRATADTAGNAGTTTSVAWTVDTTPPVLTIAGGPSGTVGSTTASFTFMPSEPGTIECSLDGAAWAPCSSPQGYTGLADGLHNFRVRSTDAAGNVGSPATQGWTVDTTPPVITVSSAPAALVNTTTATFAFGTDETATTDCAIDAGAWQSCSSPAAFTGIADGAHTFHLRATDVVGNASTTTRTWTVDTTPPAVSIDSAPSDPSPVATASVAFSTEPGASLECRLDGAAWAACASPQSLTGLADGLHAFDVRATDPAGNSAVAAASWKVDTTPPTISFASPSGPYVASAVPVTANATDGGTGVASVDVSECSDTSTGCATGAWNSLGTITGTGPYTVAWPLPGDGNRALKAVATDGAGHTTPVVANVVVDQTAPTGSLADPGPYMRAAVTLSATAADATSGVNTVDFQYSPAGANDWHTIASTSSAPYTTSFDTTGVADGSYDLRVFVTDKAGNVFAAPLATPTLVDNTPPTVAMTPPPAYVTGVVTLASTQSDAGSGIDTVTYQYRAAGTTDWTTTPAAWDTSAFHGAYEVRTVVLDKAGNETDTSPLEVYVDHTPPVTTDNAPATWQRTDVSVQLTASDPADEFGRASGVAQTEYSVDGGPYVTGSSVLVPAPADHSWDGTHTITYRSQDVAGNLETPHSTTVRIDTTAPDATIADPAPSGIMSGTVTLSSTTSDPVASDGTHSDLQKVWYQVSPAGADTWSDVPNPLDTTDLADGVYDIRVVALDNAGNGFASPAAQNKRIDNTAPTTTDNAPAGASASDVTVTLSATDAGSGVASTSFKVDGGSTQTGTSVTIPAASDHSNDGAHTIEYWSTDNAGNVESHKSATVVIDTTPPSGPALDPGSVLSGTVTLSAAPTDPNIASVKFQYTASGGSTWTTIATVTASPYQTSWNTTSVADGYYDLRFVVTDEAGNSATTVLDSKHVDNTAPTAYLTAPAAGGTMSGTIGISATASDGASGSGIAKVELQVEPSGASGFQTVATSTSSPATTSWDSRSSADGPAQIRTVATDVAGNSTTSATRTITLDNNPPTVALAGVPGNVAGVLNLGVTTSADTVKVIYQRSPAGAGIWSDIGSSSSAPFGLAWTTSGVPDGSYDLRALAKDGSGNTGTSPVTTVRVDNTAPAGSLTQPTAGSTVGGPAVQLTASASDSGSGVASVAFEWSTSGSGTWNAISTTTSSPYQATWDPTALPSGAYDLRAIVTDGAGNAYTTTAAPVNVDTTPPAVTLAAVPTPLGGTKTLSASASSDTARVVFQLRPVSGATWTTISTDTAAPFTTSFDSTAVGDGPYDVEATAYDQYGNAASSVQSGILVDNRAPTIVSSTPADGEKVASIATVSATASEPVGSVTGAAVDGNPIAPPTINGASLSFAVGSLGDGDHALTGSLVDLAGHSHPFRVNFTVWSGAITTDVPLMAKNATPDQTTTLAAADGSAQVTMPAGAYAWKSPAQDDWLVVRVHPTPPATDPGPGLAPGAPVIDVTAMWNATGVLQHTFSRPLDVVISSGAGPGVIPATLENGAWRLLRPVPSAGSLPGGWSDGFYTDASGVHILTMHLTQFTLLKDQMAPDVMPDLAGVVAADGLTIRWVPGHDNSGSIAGFTLYVNGQEYAHYGPTEYEAKLGGIQPSDGRVFTMSEHDYAGNESAQTKPLVSVPPVAGQTLGTATAALVSAGFRVGTVTYDPNAAAPAGTVTDPAGIVLQTLGSTVDLTVSGKAAPLVESKLAFNVVGTKQYSPKTRSYVAARIKVSKPSQLVATLYSPRHVRLYTWRVAAKAGTRIVKLRMPKQVRRAGLYTIVWTATSQTQVVRHTQKVRIVGVVAGRPVVIPQKPVEVVLAGDPGTRDKLALGIGSPKARLETTASVEDAFALAGNTSRNVQVVVVDVDRYGVGFLRDLRTVFPSIRLVAVSSSRRALAQARHVGADAALPRKSSAATIVKTIRGLAGLK